MWEVQAVSCNVGGVHSGRCKQCLAMWEVQAVPCNVGGAMGWSFPGGNQSEGERPPGRPPIMQLSFLCQRRHRHHGHHHRHHGHHHCLHHQHNCHQHRQLDDIKVIIITMIRHCALRSRSPLWQNDDDDGVMMMIVIIIITIIAVIIIIVVIIIMIRDRALRSESGLRLVSGLLLIGGKPQPMYHKTRDHPDEDDDDDDHDDDDDDDYDDDGDDGV